MKCWYWFLNVTESGCVLLLVIIISQRHFCSLFWYFKGSEVILIMKYKCLFCCGAVRGGGQYI